VNAVFLDTVGLLSLWDTSDQWHSAAEQAFTRITSQRVPVLTTTFVLLECGNAAARRPYRLAVDRLRETLESNRLLIRPTEEDWQQAWQAYQRDEANRAGIVDHVSFTVMRRLDLTQAFTNDHHFRAVGLETLIE
jgi:predicted nucleic acid-binding protein